MARERRRAEIVVSRKANQIKEKKQTTEQILMILEEK